jgi:hypothetical protein
MISAVSAAAMQVIVLIGRRVTFRIDALGMAIAQEVRVAVLAAATFLKGS